MKFQKLTIHNIASIEDAVIDFEAEPLADSEVFLITGKTGAGKSTILDAICLALYADTPRLYSTKMQGVTMDAKKEIKIDDPRQLMRRNTTEAYVTLTFIGSNGIYYEATWAVSRSYKRINGSIKNKIWELKNVDTQSILTKDAEIRNEIRNAIGLDFNQFCRTTMLAQGEFTRFLNSKDDEKAEILEKITGLDIYSRIGAKVYELTNRKRLEWEEARHIVEGIRTLSDGEIEEKKNTIAGLELKQKELKATNDTDSTKCDWIKTETVLSQNVADATEEFRKATEMVESDDFRSKLMLINDWNATIDARRWMTEVIKAEKELSEQKKYIESLAEDYANILYRQRVAEQEAQKVANEINTIDKFIDAEKDKATVYENVQTIVSQLTTISEGRDAINKSDEAIGKENKLLTDELIPAFACAREEAKTAKESLEQEEVNVKKKEEEVNALNLPGLRILRDEAKDLSDNINTARDYIDILASAKQSHERTRNNLAERLAAINDKKKKSAEMDSPIRDAGLKVTIRKEDLEKQKDTVNRFAATLRQKLHVGDICPICRQKIMAELPHESELSALVSGLQNEFDKAEKEYKDLIDAKNKLDAEIITESRAYERDTETFNEDKSVDNAEIKAQKACKACGIAELDDTTLSSLQTLEASTKTRKEELDARIKEGETKESAVKSLRKEMDCKRKHVETLTVKMQKTEKAADECKGRISTAETLRNTKKREVETAEQKVRELVASVSWETDWNNSPEEFGERLTKDAKTFANNIQKKQKLVSQLNAAKINNRNVEAVIDAITVAMPEWKSIDAKGTSATGNLLDNAKSIDNEVTVIQTRLKSAEENYKINKAYLDTFLAENESLTIERLTEINSYTSNDIAREDGFLKKYRDAVVAKKTLLDNANKLKHEHQERKPQLTDEETLDILVERIAYNEKQLEEIGERRGAINQELRADADNKQKLGALIKEAEEKETVYKKWSRLNQLIGNSNGSTFCKIAQSYILTSLIHSANSYMKTLTDRYTLKVTPGTFVISLEDAYQGFVSRAASTISGGESFLVSLSLALALSDIGQRWQVDTLFIDEGFGTLSGEPLQKAVETLRSLHSKAGRHVGIISHVEELQDRIPVQIQVKQEGNSSSSKIRIVPEKSPKEP